MEGKWVMVMVMAVLVMAVGKASATTPNTYWDCMRDCPGYNCYNPQRTAADCYAYCAVACSIPLATLADQDAADHYCKLGCTSSKCSTLETEAGAVAVSGCIKSCSGICSTKKGIAVVA